MPLPSGFRWPQIQKPAPKPTDHLEFGGLLLRQRNRVIHRIELDRSGVNWADGALLITIGYMEHWAPGDYYALLPSGYQTEPNYATAFINTLRVKFPQKFNPESDEVMRSTNRLGYTLYRDGEHLVVANEDKRRWYFESPDGGSTWRLHHIERINSPGLFTTLEYEDGKAVALRFPNGQKAVMHYQNRLLTRIDTPFGESLRLTRGAGGFIKEASLFHHRSIDNPQAMADNPGDYVLVETHRYQHNAEGQITQYESPSGAIYRMTYEHQAEQKDRSKQEIFTTTVRRQGDELFQYRRDEFLKATGEWVISRGTGGPSETAESAALASKSRLLPVNRRWTATSYQDPRKDIHHTQTHDKRGNVIAQVDAQGQVTSSTYNEMGKPTQTTVNGQTSIIEYNDFGQVTRRLAPDGKETLFRFDSHARMREAIAPNGQISSYGFDDRGFPTSTQRDDRTMQFVYNDWGWLTELQHPKGRVERWDYDALGRIVRHTRESPWRGGSTRTRIFHATWDKNRLVSIVEGQTLQDAQPRERFFYNRDGRLTRHDNRQSQQVIYQYDRFGRLTRKSNPEGQSHVWTYHPNGLVQTHRSWQKGEQPTTRTYDSQGLEIQQNR